MHGDYLHGYLTTVAITVHEDWHTKDASYVHADIVDNMARQLAQHIVSKLHRSEPTAWGTRHSVELNILTDTKIDPINSRPFSVRRIS
jgi:hypothetical protein